MLDSFSKNIRNAIKKLAGKPVIDEAALNEFIKEFQKALIYSDVEISLVKEISDRIKKRALETELKKGYSTKDHVIKTIYEELVRLVGGESKGIDLSSPRILLIGLFGSGKTTTSGKLGLYLKKKGLSPVLIGTDTWRPAAYNQLKKLGEDYQIPVFGEEDAKDSVRILKDGLEKHGKRHALIVDTAGRNALDKDMISELEKLKKILDPTEVLLVIPADLGQSAGKQAEAFSKVGITGIILTKLDGTGKGGGALSACAKAGAPIKFIGTGEKQIDFEHFEPERFISRLLGWGDIKALLEKAEEVSQEIEINPEDAIKNFNLEVFYEQLKAAEKMGPMKQVMGMLGMVDLPKEALEEGAGKMKNYKIIIDSMTKEEKKKPEIIKSERIERIAAGSGTSPSDVRELLSHFKKTKKMLNVFKKGRQRNLRGLMKKFGV